MWKLFTQQKISERPWSGQLPVPPFLVQSNCSLWMSPSLSKEWSLPFTIPLVPSIARRLSFQQLPDPPILCLRDQSNTHHRCMWDLFWRVLWSVTLLWVTVLAASLSAWSERRKNFLKSGLPQLQVPRFKLSLANCLKVAESYCKQSLAWHYDEQISNKGDDFGCCW